MKPHRFDYSRPDSVADALALLAEHGDAARVLAGGQSLMAMLNLRLLEPALLIDIARLEEHRALTRRETEIAASAHQLLDLSAPADRIAAGIRTTPRRNDQVLPAGDPDVRALLAGQARP